MIQPSLAVHAFRRLAVLLVLLPALGGLSGCNESWSRSRDSAILALERGDDRTALAESRRIVTSGPSSLRPEAAYLGGMAAYRLGDLGEAMRMLDIATTASDGELRGQALIQRGTVERTLGRTRESATDLQRGGELLGGDTGRKALLRAAEAYKQLGLEADARRCLDAADRLDGDRSPGSADATAIAGYTLQFGAFQSRANAEAHARRILPAIQRAGFRTVITEQDRLYKVQADACFRDIRSAQSALRRVSLPSGIGATITEVGR